MEMNDNAGTFNLLEPPLNLVFFDYKQYLKSAPDYQNGGREKACMPECLRAGAEALVVSVINYREAYACAFVTDSSALNVTLRQSGQEASFWRLFFGSFLWTNKERDEKAIRYVHQDK